MTRPVIVQSYVPAAGRAKTDLHLHRPRKRLGLHRRTRAYRCEWCREVSGREGCANRQRSLRLWETATTPVERAALARQDTYLLTVPEAHEILSLAEAETVPVFAPTPSPWAPNPYMWDRSAA